MNRGDVILVRFPHASGMRGKKRPAVVVQSDAYAAAVSTVVVAEVTKNLTMAADPACLFIDVSTPEGKALGLIRDSVVTCFVLVTIYTDTVAQVLGSLSAAMEQRLGDVVVGNVLVELGPSLSAAMEQRLGDCLKVALGLS